MMKYYKSKTGEVYAYEDGQKPIKGLTPMTDEEVEAHLNPQPTLEQIKQARIEEIQLRLNQIDIESIRPIRAIQKGVGTEFDTQKLESLELEAETLREELRGLND